MTEKQLRQPYLKVLSALSGGQPKTSNELSMECGFESRLDCTGAISFLRRVDAIDQAGHGKYRITDKGKIMLQRAPKVELSQRGER